MRKFVKFMKKQKVIKMINSNNKTSYICECPICLNHTYNIDFDDYLICKLCGSPMRVKMINKKWQL